MTLLLVVVLFYLPQNCLWSALVQPQASVVVQLRIKMVYVELVLWDVLVVRLAYWNSVDVKWTGIILCAGVVHVWLLAGVGLLSGLIGRKDLLGKWSRLPMHVDESDRRRSLPLPSSTGRSMWVNLGSLATRYLSWGWVWLWGRQVVARFDILNW